MSAHSLTLRSGRSVPKAAKAVGRNGRSGDVDFFEASHRGDVLQAGVGDLRSPEIEFLQTGQPAKMRYA